MLEEIKSTADQISLLCERYYVRRLELFGSAATAHFDPKKSDLDFLVRFGDIPQGERFDSFFGLLESLEHLFKRKIDIVEAQAIRNPHFLETIQQSPRVVIYGKENESLFA